MKAWHWMRNDGSLGYGDTRVPKDGEVLKHIGKLELCHSGLHASRCPLDALWYAPACTIARVECGGDVIENVDKLACTERTILWRSYATETLRHFARLCALDVVNLWDAPEVVKRWLRTVDESIRSEAYEAIYAGIYAPSRSAARSAYSAYSAYSARSAYPCVPARAAYHAASSARDAYYALSPRSPRSARSARSARSKQSKRLHRMLLEARVQ